MESGVPPPPAATASILETSASTTGDGSALLDGQPPPPTLPELPATAEVPSPSQPSGISPCPPAATSPTVLATAIQRVDSLTVEAVAAVSAAVRPIHSPDASIESLGEALAGAPRPSSRQDVGTGGSRPYRPRLVGRLPVVGEEMPNDEAAPAEGSTAAATDGSIEHPPPVASSPPPPVRSPTSGGSPGRGSTGGEDTATGDEELVAAIAGMKASPLAARAADALVHAVRRVDSMTPATAEEVAAALGPRPRELPAAGRAATKESSAKVVGGTPPGPAKVAPVNDAAASNFSAGGGHGSAGGSGGRGGGLPPKPPSDAHPGHRRGDTLVRAIAAADDATLRAAAAVADAVVRVDTEDEGLDVGTTTVTFSSSDGKMR
ncbi:hypothetical protein MMPV_008585 [Pyropia vietnamensis]